MLYLLNLRKHANQVELDQFFAVIKESGKRFKTVTKSAFFQARKQLSHHAFIELNDLLIDTVYAQAESIKTWKGFRLCAIDGTSIRLPDEPDIVDTFGRHQGRADQVGCAIAMGSVFYDVLNHLVIDSAIHPNLTSERQCAEEHLTRSMDNDLILYDRGYGAFWLYALHRQLGRHFCMRSKVRQCLLSQVFVKSGKKETVVTFTANKTTLKTCNEKGLNAKPITLRLIRVDLPNEVEVLVTNLTDLEQVNADEFKDLYHLRWGIEENYKRLKQWVEIENFSGKSTLSVEQDFYAKIVAANLSALLAIEAQQKVDKKMRKCRLNYRVNFAYALSVMKHRLIVLVLRAQGSIEDMVVQTIERMSMRYEAIRPGRKAPRRLRNIKNDIHYPSYKSAL
jgi:hypothetical protein